MTQVEYHDCPKHGKERCYRDPNNPKHHACQSFDFRQRKKVDAWDEPEIETLVK